MKIQLVRIVLDTGIEVHGVISVEVPDLSGEVIALGTSEILDIVPDTPIDVVFQRAKLAAQESDTVN